ncbi:MAG: hypothetical protein KatS3mg002_1225 [Candidatus Woesearchaeota archaeon]|nr:MAG: hypothetical protein KatS3mg002_1225 [Candidatus Woesearchaeota archaeon]
MNGLRIAGILLIIALAFGAIELVVAEPTGPTNPITPLSSSRFGLSSAQTANAYAGNVTEFNLNANTITQTWQGYFGNITGKIVLGNSNNNTLYDWTLTNPQGEIYATRLSTVPTWSSISCAGLSDIIAEETALGVNASIHRDSIQNTFSNTTNFTTFYVGSVMINQSSQDCYATHLYNSTGQQNVYFPEILLRDGSGEIIYTGLIEDDVLGFDGRTHDFQIIVGENGHNGDTTPSVYYFYLELE